MQSQMNGKSTGQIDRELSHLQDTIADLESALGDLLPRLDVVCSASTPQEQTAKEPTEELCTVADRVQSYRISIRNCIASIADYNTRIQL